MLAPRLHGFMEQANVRTYYQQYEAQLNQSLIDQKVKEHLGASFRPPPPYAAMRPGLPVMHAPMQMPGGGQLPPGMQLLPGMRPPLMPRPLPGPPGTVASPTSFSLYLDSFWLILMLLVLSIDHLLIPIWNFVPPYNLVIEL